MASKIPLRRCIALMLLFGISSTGLSARAESTLSIVPPMRGYQLDHGNGIGLRLRFDPPLRPGDQASVKLESSVAFELLPEAGNVVEFRTRIRLTKTSIVSADIVRKGGAAESTKTTAQVSTPASPALDDNQPVKVNWARLDDELRKTYDIEGEGCLYLVYLANAENRFLKEAKLGANAEVRVLGSAILSKNPFFAVIAETPPSDCKLIYTLSK